MVLSGDAMNEEELKSLLIPFMDKKLEGIFGRGEFDLDIKDGKYVLWFDSETSVDFPHGTDPTSIQKVVRSFGRELLHTWDLQYSVNP